MHQGLSAKYTASDKKLSKPRLQPLSQVKNLIKENLQTPPIEWIRVVDGANMLHSLQHYTQTPPAELAEGILNGMRLKLAVYKGATKDYATNKALIDACFNSYQTFHDRRLISQGSLEIGQYYLKVERKPQDALKHILKAYRQFTASKELTWAFNALVHLAMNYYELNNYSAIFKLESEIERFCLAGSDEATNYQCQFMFIKGCAYSKLQDFEQAQICFNACDALMTEHLEHMGLKSLIEIEKAYIAERQEARLSAVMERLELERQAASSAVGEPTYFFELYDKDTRLKKGRDLVKEVFQKKKQKLLNKYELTKDQHAEQADCQDAERQKIYMNSEGTVQLFTTCKLHR